MWWRRCRQHQTAPVAPRSSGSRPPSAAPSRNRRRGVGHPPGYEPAPTPCSTVGTPRSRVTRPVVSMASGQQRAHFQTPPRRSGRCAARIPGRSPYVPPVRATAPVVRRRHGPCPPRRNRRRRGSPDDRPSGSRSPSVRAPGLSCILHGSDYGFVHAVLLGGLCVHFARDRASSPGKVLARVFRQRLQTWRLKARILRWGGPCTSAAAVGWRPSPRGSRR